MLTHPKLSDARNQHVSNLNSFISMVDTCKPPGSDTACVLIWLLINIDELNIHKNNIIENYNWLFNLHIIVFNLNFWNYIYIPVHNMEVLAWKIHWCDHLVVFLVESGSMMGHSVIHLPWLLFLVQLPMLWSAAHRRDNDDFV